MIEHSAASTLELSPTSISFAWDASSSQTVNVTSNTTWDIVTT